MNDRPRLVIIAGANGAGKSTIAAAPHARSLLGDARAINPDEYTRALRERHSLPRDAANLLAVVQTELEVWRALAEGKSVAVETVLSTDNTWPPLAPLAREDFTSCFSTLHSQQLSTPSLVCVRAWPREATVFLSRRYASDGTDPSTTSFYS